MRVRLSSSVAVGLLLGASLASAADPISDTSFDNVPAETTMAAGAITLGAPVTVQGPLTFNDGSVQESAAGAAENGLYSNRIVLVTPADPYAEVCFKNGGVFGEAHDGGDSTAEGACVPGDIGWIIERNERNPVDQWSGARGTCMKLGFRLPETFELKFSCDNNTLLALGLANVDEDLEWASNHPVPMTDAGATTRYAIAAPLFGGTNCKGGSWAFVASVDEQEFAAPFRCVR